MPFRFHKSFKILPGVRLNVNGHSLSLTEGAGRVHETQSTTGRNTTSVRLFKGLSWRKSGRR